MARNRILFRKLTVVLFVMLFAALAAFAQTVISGDLTGTVTDQQGAVVTDAKVTLKSLATGSIETTTTNKTGAYRFSLLKPGKYTVTVAQAGFKKVEVTTEISVGQATHTDFHLAIGQAGEVVNVIEQTNLVDSENANLTTTYSPEELATIPSPGNDTTAYALTTPGITLSTGNGYGNFSANGLPGNANLFTTNGFDNNDSWNNLNNSGASNLTLGANELQEMTVVANGYTGQYGRQAGAQINSVTKSGGNAFHGNALYWWNGRAMNANDWENKAGGGTRPFANNNEYAASIGGPVIKNKLFFFANTEGLRVVLPAGGGTTYIPTPGFATAVQSNIALNQPSALPFYQNIFKLYQGAHSGAATPLTGDGGCGSADGQTIGGTKFGTGYAPCAATYFSSLPATQNEWLFMTRIDYNFNDNDRMFGRFKSDHGVQATSTDPINSAFSANSNQPAYEGQLQETHIFSSRTVNQFILGGSWYKAIFGPTDFAAAVATFPTTMAFNDSNITPLGGADNNYPSGRTMTQYMIIDDLSHTAGAHDLKFGVNFRGNKFGDYYHLANSAGNLGLDMVDFVNGSFDTTTSSNSTYSQNFPSIGQIPVTSYSLGLYAQDAWKVNSRLSVTLALRADRNSNLHCLKNCFSRLTGPFESLTHDASIPYNQVIATGQEYAFPSIEKIVFEPRFGAVYDFGHGIVMRGGLGLFSDLFPASLMRFAMQAPNVATYSATGANIIAAPGVAGSFFANTAAQNAAFQQGFASGGTTTSLGVTLPMYTFPNLVKNSKFTEWNYQIEKQVTSKGALTVNYVGNHGFDLFIQNPYANASSKSVAMNGLPATTPDPRFGQIVEYSNNGYSNYNGLTGSFKWRFSGLFQGSFSYTWSHGLDTCSNECIYQFNLGTAASIRGLISPQGTQLNYGSSDYDTRHGLNANYVFTTPRFANTALRQVASAWSLAGTVYYHSGYPFSFINTSAPGDINNATGLLTGTVLADYLGSSKVTCSSPTTACVAQTSFVQGTQQNFGNLARNSFRGPGYFDTDLQIMKTFTLRESTKLAVGANFFNILNHPNFDLPANDAAKSNVGQIISTVSSTTSPYGSFVGALASGRLVQMHVRLTF
jgi:hypothetical protein